MGVLAPALRRNIGSRSFQDFQQGLLYAFTGNVPGNGNVFRLPGNLVNFININNASLGFFNIVIRILDQAQQNVFHVFSHIPGFGQCGSIRNGKGYLQDPGQRLGQQGLPAAGRSQHQDIGFLQFHILIFRPRASVIDPFVMIIYRNSQRLLRLILANYILVQNRLDLLRCRQVLQRFRRRNIIILFVFFFQDFGTQFDTLVANVPVTTGQHPLHLIVSFSAERTNHITFFIIRKTHL